jgi:hypothetical protein
MTKKLPLNDFRAVRSKLESHEFAISSGQDVPPSELVDPDIWDGIMHLPEDVSIRISDHNGLRLRLMYQLWGDWVEAIGDPDNPDEMFNCLLEAADCFQGATFTFLHGFYRTALAELRTALELVMIGTYGTLYPTDDDYRQWKSGKSENFGFTRCRKRLSGRLKTAQAKWMFEDGELLALMFQKLCRYTHARPAFLERSAGIAFGQTLRFGRCERNKGTVETTKIWSPKTGCPYVPPHVGSQRHPYFHGPNAGNVKTVYVRFWNKYLIARPEQRRQFCQHSPVGAEQWTEVQELQFV